MKVFKRERVHGEMKMADLILNNHFQIFVLERFGIELGVKEKTIAAVCNEYNIGVEVFLTVANMQNNIPYLPDSLLNRADIFEIIQYLKRSHAYFSNEVFPEIITNIHQMRQFNDKPEILMVEEFFNDYKNEVDQHFDYENEHVFPYILTLFEGGKAEQLQRAYSVNDYKEHHDDIEEKLDDLKKLLIQHLSQKKDCIIRRKILFSLFDLEQDLFIHTKIENAVLIPLVEKIERLNR